MNQILCLFAHSHCFAVNSLQHLEMVPLFLLMYATVVLLSLSITCTFALLFQNDFKLKNATILA